MIWPWSELRRLRKQLDEARNRAWRAEHWNEPECADLGSEPFAWATCPVELPADTIIEKATISGPPWTVRLTAKYPKSDLFGEGT